MITQSTFKYLASQKQKDAFALFRQERYSAAVYLMGYALKFSLKRKISQTLGFSKGFPESANELSIYSRQISTFNSISTGVRLTQLRQIKIII